MKTLKITPGLLSTFETFLTAIFVICIIQNSSDLYIITTGVLAIVTVAISILIILCKDFEDASFPIGVTLYLWMAENAVFSGYFYSNKLNDPMIPGLVACFISTTLGAVLFLFFTVNFLLKCVQFKTTRQCCCVVSSSPTGYNTLAANLV